MAIIAVDEDYTGDTSDESMTDEFRMRIAGVSTRAFDVVFDADCGSPAALSVAAETAGIPAMYDVYPGQDWLFASRRRAIRTGPLRCQVTVDYTSDVKPLSADPEYSWDFVVSQEPVDRDNADNPIQNSAGEPFDPPVTREVYDLVLRYRDNISAFDPIIAESYIGAINSDAVLGYAAGSVKCTKYTGSEARAAVNASYLPTGKYYVRNLEFVFRSDSWQRQILDEGFRIATGTDGDGNTTYKIMQDEDGKPLSLPVKLDGSGDKLAAAASPVFNTFDLEKTAVFYGLGVIL